MVAESPNGVSLAAATPPMSGNASAQGYPLADVEGGKFAALANEAVGMGITGPVSERDSGARIAEHQDGLDPEKLR